MFIAKYSDKVKRLALLPGILAITLSNVTRTDSFQRLEWTTNERETSQHTALAWTQKRLAHKHQEISHEKNQTTATGFLLL